MNSNEIRPELIDPDRANELLNISGDIIEAAEATGDDALQAHIAGYTYATENIDHCRAHLKHLARSGMEYSDTAEHARRLLQQNEQLAAHFLDQLDRHLNR